MKKRVVIICPGRGSYTKETLGYLKKYQNRFTDFIQLLDAQKKQLGELTITELDEASQFSPNKHTKGENASALIYACSYCDFLSLNRDEFEVVAVTGNSMGWYIAMAVAGSLDPLSAFKVINTMGSMMKDNIIGGQIIYPIVDADWKLDLDVQSHVLNLIQDVNSQPDCEAHVSIYLGGYLVIGGNQKALDILLQALPKKENYPFQLVNHAAFHTPLLKTTSEQAFHELPIDLFQTPKIPMVDGRGFLWNPYTTNIQDLYEYTLGHQVTETYDFTTAVTYCLKEFCPDHLVLLGPSNSLGGSIGQILVKNNWMNIDSKSTFSQVQRDNPFLISMGLQK